jgi:hypothetical protein
MKRTPTILKTVFSLTIISMFVITKWWFAIPVDGPDKLYWGFPFAFMGEGFHTSMSLQFFVLEFLADFAVYFTIIFLLVLLFTKWFPSIKIHKSITLATRILALVLLTGFGFIAATSNPVFSIKRVYDWRVLTTGYVLIWQPRPRPDINLYQPK